MSLKRNKNNVIFNLMFIALILGFLLFDNILHLLFYVLSVVIHEFAHSFVAKKLGYKLDNMYLMPYGVCLNYKCNVFANNDEAYIAIAGPVSNFLVCLLCLSLWWLFPETYYYLDYFCFCNLLLATFNLLPCYPLDGGRIVLCLASRITKREKAYNVVLILNFVFSAILCLLFVKSIFDSVNYSYMFIAIFLFSGTLNNDKLSSYKHYMIDYNKDKLLTKGTNVKILAFSSNTKLFKIMTRFSKYKFNVVYIAFKNGMVKVLSERNIVNLAVRYGSNVAIEEIMEQMN